MALIHIFKDIGKTHETLQGCGKLSSIVNSVNWDNCIILRAGRRIDKGFIIENDDDIIFIRELPRATMAVLIGISIAVGVAALGVGIGAAIYSKIKSDQTKEEMEKAQRAAEELSKKTGDKPFLKGAKNRTAIGNLIPFIMGEMYHTPYLLTNGSYTISGKKGENQYWNAVLCVGYNGIVIRSLSIGNTIIKKWDTDGPQNGIFTMDGGTYYDSENLIEIRQTGELSTPVFRQKAVCENYGDAIEHEFGKEAKPVVKQCGENAMAVEACVLFQGLRKFNDDGNWESLSVRLVPYWTNNPDDPEPTWHKFKFSNDDKDDPKNLGMTLPVWGYDEDGKWVVIKPSVPILKDEENTFTHNSRDEMRFVARKEFSAAEAFGKKISVKVVRETPEQESNSQEKCYLLFINTFCYDPQKSSDKQLSPCLPLEPAVRDKSCRIGIRMRANENTKDNLDEFNIIATGCARDFTDGTLNTWKSPTRNPASWLLELLTTPHHPHSRYKDEELDLESFAELYRYCEAEGFYTDGIITKAKKKRDTAEDILKTVGASLINNLDGKLEAVIDRKEETPVALLNSQDVISVTVSKSLERKTDGRKVTFTNRKAWKTDCIYVMRDGRTGKTDDDTVTETAIDFVTGTDHAWKIARRELAAESLNPREVRVQVGKEGDYYPLYSTVLLQLSQLKQGIASSVIHKAELKNGFIQEIEIADLVEFVSGNRYGVIIQAMNKTGRKLFYSEAQGEGLTKRLTLKSPIRTDAVIPEYGNIVSFGLLGENGEFEKITNVMKIYAVSPSDDGWTLTLRDYNEAVYEYGEIPEYKTNLTTPPTNATKLPTVTPGMLQGAVAEMSGKVDHMVDGDAPDAPAGLVAFAEKDGIYVYWNIGGAGLNNSIQHTEIEIKKGGKWYTFTAAGIDFIYKFDRLTDGYPEAEGLGPWRIRARFVNVYGKYSPYAGGEAGQPLDLSRYSTWRLEPVDFTASAERDYVSIKIINDKNSAVYGDHVFLIKVNKNEEEVSRSDAFNYIYNRTTDGYPEKEDFKNWVISVTVQNEATFAKKEIQGGAINLSKYKTWLTPPIAVEGCVAKEDGIYSEWAVDSSLTFGDIRFQFDLFYGGAGAGALVISKNNIIQAFYNYLFNRDADADGFPEKDETVKQLAALGLPAKGRNLALYDIRLTAYTLQRQDVKSSKNIKVTTDYYGTWVPSVPLAVGVKSARDAVRVEITPDIGPLHYGTPYSYIIERSKNGTEWERVKSESTVYDWPIDRETDGYPEAEGLNTWRFRVKAVSTAGNGSLYWGGTEAGEAPDISAYGTWKVKTPHITATISGRTITLTMQQPVQADKRDLYGTVKHRLQIQKPETSAEWLKPAQNLDPYASEDNWQAGAGELTVDNIYTQTMPLTGQTIRDETVEGKPVKQSAPVATLYRFKITAFNEAGEAAAAEVNATALATGIQDIVQGSVTHDKISTPSLAAISANMGVISSGGFSGSSLNYWYLSTIMGQLGIKDRYEGAMRVGGKDEYLLVEPIVKNGQVTSYKIIFKVGNFEVSSEASRVNGELVVMEHPAALDRTRITPVGTYYEHRETSDTEGWEAVSRMRTEGILAKSLFSDNTLIIANTAVQDRRLRNHDVGRPYLSKAARVWHFDTDLLDQYQREGLAVQAIGDVLLADQYNTAGSEIDFTPAILAVAPYSEIGRSAYGQFSAVISLPATNTLTVDFWIQYIWSENQTLFDIGNANDRIKLVIANDEAYFNDYSAGRDEAPFNQEILEPGDVIVLNEPAQASSTIQHYGNTVPVPDTDHVRSFDQMGISFKRNEWLHIGIIITEEVISCYLNKTRVDFPRYASAPDYISVVLNELQNTLILDELYIDAEAIEEFSDFAANTDGRIPWGALDKNKKYFILDAENFLTNIFDTDIFKEKVKSLILEGKADAN